MNDSEIRIQDRAKFSEEMQWRASKSRYMLVGVCAWISLCLLLAGWVPELSSGLSVVWLISGLMGLCASVALAKAIKEDSLMQGNLFGVYMQAAMTDGLTGLANRHSLDGRLRELLKESAASGQCLSMVMVDIDHFKAFNDQWGHLAGDAVLKSVAKRLRNHFGSCAFVARYGGEEFAIVLAGYRLHNARDFAESCRVTIKGSEHTYQECSFQVTISAGITESLPSDTVDTITQRADLALYTAKRLGRDLVWVDTPTLVSQPRIQTQETSLEISTTMTSIDLQVSRA